MSTGEKSNDFERQRRKIKCVKQMKEIMTQYYIEAKTAAQTGKKVAWITSGGPVEPLIAMVCHSGVSGKSRCDDRRS